MSEVGGLSGLKMCQSFHNHQVKSKIVVQVRSAIAPPELGNAHDAESDDLGNLK